MSIVFIQKKYGAWILLVLDILLLLFGGGSPPLAQGLLACAMATRIDKPLKWWRAHLNIKARSLFARCWPSCLIMYVIFSVFSVLIAIAGVPLTFIIDPRAGYFFTILLILGDIALVLSIISVLAAIAFDIRRKNEN